MADPPVRRETPLDPDEYDNRREELGASYVKSMGEYDRLVTWASGGALALSITFLEKFGQGADPATGWWLATGWTFLGLAFATSLWSHYFSSRIYSWRRQELDHLQLAPDARSNDWASRARRLDRRASEYGAATKWLTFVSGLLLIGGMMSVAKFAFLNAPFYSATQDTSRPAAPATDKKGLEYIPEPVPRPQPPPPVEPSQEKR